MRAVVLKEGIPFCLLAVMLLATVTGCAAPVKTPPTEVSPSEMEEK